MTFQQELDRLVSDFKPHFCRPNQGRVMRLAERHLDFWRWVFALRPAVRRRRSSPSGRAAAARARQSSSPSPTWPESRRGATASTFRKRSSRRICT